MLLHSNQKNIGFWLYSLKPFDIRHSIIWQPFEWRNMAEFPFQIYGVRKMKGIDFQKNERENVEMFDYAERREMMESAERRTEKRRTRNKKCKALGKSLLCVPEGFPFSFSIQHSAPFPLLSYFFSAYLLSLPLVSIPLYLSKYVVYAGLLWLWPVPL